MRSVSGASLAVVAMLTLGSFTAACGQVNVIKARKAFKSANQSYQAQDYKKAARAQLLKESPGLLDLIELKLRNRANDIKPGAGMKVPALGPGLTLPGARP